LFIQSPTETTYCFLWLNTLPSACYFTPTTHNPDAHMAEETKEETSFERLLQKVLKHLETRWEYYSLTTTEKISGAAAMLTGIAIIAIFSLIILFFLSIGFAVWLGDYLGNRAGGFALAALIFVPIAIVAYMKVPAFVRAKIIQNILDDDDTENKG
jgi:hypothetical protein